jgi:hypothetical protein
VEVNRQLASRFRSESGWDAAVCWSIGRAGGKVGVGMCRRIGKCQGLGGHKGVGGNTDAAEWGAEAFACHVVLTKSRHCFACLPLGSRPTSASHVDRGTQ